MSGRIKVLEGGAKVQEADEPPLPADYYKVPSAYDASCGTYGVGDYTADAHALFVLRRVRPNAPPRDHALRWWHAWALERGLADPDAKSPDASPAAGPCGRGATATRGAAYMTDRAGAPGFPRGPDPARRAAPPPSPLPPFSIPKFILQNLDL